MSLPDVSLASPRQAHLALASSSQADLAGNPVLNMRAACLTGVLGLLSLVCRQEDMAFSLLV